jgi:hypothetical protein
MCIILVAGIALWQLIVFGQAAADGPNARVIPKTWDQES